MFWKMVAFDIRANIFEKDNLLLDQLLLLGFKRHASIQEMSYCPSWYSHVEFMLYHVGYGVGRGSIALGVTNDF